jgi:hypothetical protein
MLFALFTVFSVLLEHPQSPAATICELDAARTFCKNGGA